MFKPFTRSAKSWGSLAHVEDDIFNRMICDRGAIIEARAFCKPNSRYKPFAISKTEKIVIQRKSNEITVLASSQDSSFDEARTANFVFEPNDLFDEVTRLIELKGLNVKEFSTSTHSSYKKSA